MSKLYVNELHPKTTGGQIIMPNTPAFNVYNSTDNPIVVSNGLFPIDAIRVNIGNHFNTGTSLFTAPVSGTYFFSFRSITNVAVTSIRTYINGVTDEFLNYENSGQTNWHATNGSTIRSLSAADTFGIWIDNTSTTLHGGIHNAFCGHLIG
jgi:hypothetical protein